MVIRVKTLFAYRNFFAKCDKSENIHQRLFKTRNGLIQMIKMDRSTSLKGLILGQN